MHSLHTAYTANSITLPTVSTLCLKLTMSGALEDEWLDDGAIKIGSDEEYH